MLFLIAMMACSTMTAVDAPDEAPTAEKIPWSRLGPVSKGGAPIKPSWYDAFFGPVTLHESGEEKFTEETDTGYDTDVYVDTDPPPRDTGVPEDTAKPDPQ